MTGADTPDVTAVIVNWNTRDLLADCLESLVHHPPVDRSMEMIVVDNGSTDGSVELLRTGWPQVRVIANEDNLGFTKANNQAFAIARGRVLLLINADARVEPGCLDTLLGRLDADPRAAIVGPRLTYGDGSWQRWTAGQAPTLRSAAGHFLFLERVIGRRGPGIGIYLGRDVRTPFRPDWVSRARWHRSTSSM